MRSAALEKVGVGCKPHDLFIWLIGGVPVYDVTWNKGDLFRAFSLPNSARISAILG